MSGDNDMPATEVRVNRECPEGKRAWVLSEGPSASTDYFVFPWLNRNGYSVELFDVRQAPSSEILSNTPSIIVISRYLHQGWVSLLQEAACNDVEIVYFMDDDLFDSHVLSGLPWRYRWKILSKALMQYSRIRRLCGEFWVSTPYLANKYSHLNPLVLSPSPSAALVSSMPLVRICYHGTASHPAEIVWLREVIAKVQSLTDNCHFEIFGDATVKKQYAGIPRVSVMHAMSWPDYLLWSATEPRDIALAPLLDSPFNAARGPTKFFDYTRMQAAGIYSDGAPYRGFINDGVDGVLLDNDPTRWVDMILQLALDAERRRTIASAATQRVVALAKG